MKFTINIPINRADYLDDNGHPPDESISDIQLLLWDAEADYHAFREDITSLILDQMVEQMP